MEKREYNDRKKAMRFSDTGIIELEGMEFHAYHGCFEKERAEGNLFIVDFKGCYAFKKAAESDNLHDAVDYGDVYKVVREQMETPSNLIENVAWRIAESIRRNFPEFHEFTVRISKKNPPVGGACQWSRFTVKYPEELMPSTRDTVRNNP